MWTRRRPGGNRCDATERLGAIPVPDYHQPLTHSRMPIEVVFEGWSMRQFRAQQQWSAPTTVGRSTRNWKAASTSTGHSCARPFGPSLGSPKHSQLQLPRSGSDGQPIERSQLTHLKGDKSRKLVLATSGIAVIALGFAVPVALLWRYGRAGATIPFGNFAPTLYCLAVGGQGWLQVLCRSSPTCGVA